MDSNPVGWFEIYVKDMPRARAFYEALLGVTLQSLEMPDAEMWAFPMQMNAAGAAGSLVRMDGFAPGAGGTLVYFVCEDCAVEAGRAEAAGGRIERPKFPIGEHGFCALVIDTEGNRIGLHSMR